MNQIIPILNPTERAQIQAQLDDALKQYHALMTGTAPRVVVDQNGQRVEFTAANRGDLNSYILRLQASLGLPGTMSAMPLRPASFIF